MNTEIIKRVALGRRIQLGGFYNAHTNTFCGDHSIFQSPSSVQHFLELVPTPRTRCFIAHTNTRSGRCETLGLGDDEKLSALMTDCPLAGSARFISEDECDGCTTISLIHANQVSTQALNVYNEKAKRRISPEIATQCNATHVVTGIEFGINSIIAISFRSGTCDKNDVSNNLEMRILTAVKKSFDETDVQQLKNLHSYIPDAKIDFYTDFDLAEQNVWTLGQCALYLKRIASSLNEKTAVLKPLTYTLMPVHIIEQLKTGRICMQKPLKFADTAMAEKIAYFLENLWRCQASLGALCLKVKDHSSLFSAAAANSVNERAAEVARKIQNSKLQVGNDMKDFRRNELTLDGLEKELRQSQTVLDEAKTCIRDFNFVDEKLFYVAKLKKMRVDVASDSQNFAKKLQSGDEYFVLYANFSAISDIDAFRQQWKIFKKLSRLHAEKCIFFDTATIPLQGFESHICVHYIASKCTENDVCRLYSLLETCNVIRFNSAPQKIPELPKNRVWAEIACPSVACGGGCSGEKRKWKCYHCQQTIEYGFKNRFYCSCGESDPYSAFWFCNDPVHGTSYLRFEKDELAKQLSEIQESKEYNIILLGETGCGKSTLINSMVNYILYEDLETALKYPAVILVPTCFSMPTDTDARNRLRVGRSYNESFLEGTSATLKPKSYTFTYDNALIRIIDVPGVCDTRGPKQDKENFKLILEELQTIPSLHAICILLGPEISRLTGSFKYCIGELLTHLHVEAAKNIVFCLTKTRGSFYEGGETLALLAKYLHNFAQVRGIKIPLEKYTTYCFDNEAIKFLYGTEEGIKFPLEHRNFYNQSWTKSAEATFRFLKYVLKLEPHRTREMLSLNEARRLISMLLAPLNKVTGIIEKNLEDLDAKIEEVGKLQLSAADLKQRLTLKQTTLVIKEIDHPRTVCTSKKCTESVRLPETYTETVYYKQVCHDNCHLQGVETHSCPDPRIKECHGMEKNICRACGCGWETHMHICYIQEVKEIFVIDRDVEQKLRENEQEQAVIRLARDRYQERICDLRKRRDIVVKACEQFAAFVKQNSLKAQNEDLIQYLELAIKAAKDKAKTNHNENELKTLKRLLKDCEMEKELMTKDGIETREITLQDIEKTKRALYSLHSFECNVAEYIKSIERENNRHYHRMDDFFDIGKNMAIKNQRNILTRDPSPASGILDRICEHIRSNDSFHNDGEERRQQEQYSDTLFVGDVP